MRFSVLCALNWLLGRLLWIQISLCSQLVARQVAMDTDLSVPSTGCYGYRLFSSCCYGYIRIALASMRRRVSHGGKRTSGCS